MFSDVYVLSRQVVPGEGGRKGRSGWNPNQLTYPLARSGLVCRAMVGVTWKC